MGRGGGCDRIGRREGFEVRLHVVQVDRARRRAPLLRQRASPREAPEPDRLDEPALVVPYLVVTPTFYVQNSRFVLPGTQIVDVDGHFFGVPVTFSVEIPVGPGGVFVQGTYRAAFEVGDGGEAVPLRGGLGEAGYHLLF